MSLKAKTIAFSAVALIVVGGSTYAFMSNDPLGSPDRPVSANSVDTPEQTDLAASQEILNEKDKGKVEAPAAADVKQTTSQARPAGQPPKKLTKEQLLPPLVTEAEKLEKAAQQESNF